MRMNSHFQDIQQALKDNLFDFQLDHVQGDVDDQIRDEYEPPTPSDGQDYQDNFERPF